MAESLERVVEFSKIFSAKFDNIIAEIVREGNRTHLLLDDDFVLKGAYVMLEDGDDVLRKDFDFSLYGLARDGNRIIFGGNSNKTGILIEMEEREEVSRTEYEANISCVAVFDNRRYIGLVDDAAEECFLSIEEDGKEVSRVNLDGLVLAIAKDDKGRILLGTGLSDENKGSVIFLENDKEVSRINYDGMVTGIAVDGNKMFVAHADEDEDKSILTIYEDGKEIDRKEFDEQLLSLDICGDEITYALAKSMNETTLEIHKFRDIYKIPVEEMKKPNQLFERMLMVERFYKPNDIKALIAKDRSLDEETIVASEDDRISLALEERFKELGFKKKNGPFLPGFGQKYTYVSENLFVTAIAKYYEKNELVYMLGFYGRPDSNIKNTMSEIRKFFKKQGFRNIRLKSGSRRTYDFE